MVLKMKIFEQHNKEGKLRTVLDWFSASMANFQQSMGLASPFTFFGMVALIYDRYFRQYISTVNFGILFIIILVVYQLTYYKYLYPALVRFNSKQSWKHINPMKDDIVEIKKQLDRIEDNMIKDCYVKMKGEGNE